MYLTGKYTFIPHMILMPEMLFDDLGSHFAMEDYHVLSMNSPEDKEAADHGIALHVKDVPWAVRQMWAPDAAEKDGRFISIFQPRIMKEYFA
uniref:CAZy families GH43 protein n=1 Tax=uncultured Teredinibacter sp. TaxID=1434395 RepID=A0A060CFG1_9GAMM|nr:CAZy families GH43 protein [uncultured Teredinibacter sp.]